MNIRSFLYILFVIIVLFSFQKIILADNVYLVGPEYTYKKNSGGVCPGPSLKEGKYKIKVAEAGIEGLDKPEKFIDFEPFDFRVGNKYLINIIDKDGLSIYVEENPSRLETCPVPENDGVIYFNNMTCKHMWYAVEIVFSREKGGFVGTWYGFSRGNYKEVWLVEHVSSIWKVSGKYYQEEKEVGSFKGENVTVKEGNLYFRQIMEDLPEADWPVINNIEASLDGDNIIYKWDTGIESGEGELERKIKE